MKYILIAVIAFGLASCHDSHIRREIKDDGRTLTIKVDVQTDAQHIYYKQIFNVSGMNSGQKKALKNYIYDSLGVNQ